MKLYTLSDLISFGNYLLSKERNDNIEDPENKNQVGDWDIVNWEDKK